MDGQNGVNGDEAASALEIIYPETPTQHNILDSPSEPCGPRRDSTEDANPALTRKRQRLDSGVEGSRSLSADPGTMTPSPARENNPTDRNIPTSSPSASSSPSPASSTTAAIPTPSGDEQASDIDDDSARPESELVDPVQNSDLAGQSATIASTNEVTLSLRNGQADTVTTPADVSPAVAEKSPVTTISELKSSSRRSSSPKTEPTPPRNAQQDPDGASNTLTPDSMHQSASNQSPDVEVADIDPMEQDYEVTDWSSPSTDSEMSRAELRRSLLRKFPYWSDTNDMREIVNRISHGFEKGEVDAAVLRETGRWIRLCVDKVEQYSLDWAELYFDYEFFWSEVPGMIEGLLKRTTPLGGHFSGVRSLPIHINEIKAIEELFLQYTRLTFQLVNDDVTKMRSSTDQTQPPPQLTSCKFLIPLYYILCAIPGKSIPLWTMFRNYYAYDIDQVSVAVPAWIVTSPANALALLLEYSQLLLTRIVKIHQAIKHFVKPITIIKGIALIAIDRNRSLLAGDPDAPADIWPGLAPRIADFCRGLDAQLHSIVEKQQVLPREVLKEMCLHLYPILTDVCQISQPLAQSLVEEKGDSVQGFAAPEFAQIVAHVWKFHLLKKCIMNGRMELRIQSLEFMCQDLAETYKIYAAQEARKALMEYFAEFIREQRMIEYLVGPDSHAQLIERCGNIAGFLVVTNQYTDADSDVIWRAVKSSQDPRNVAPILSMVRAFLNLADYALIMYLCKKLNELPLEAFDPLMLDFLRMVLSYARDKYQREPRPELNDAGHELCIRLIRQSSERQENCRESISAISLFAAKELQELLQWASSPEIQRKIYVECVKDVEEKNSNATGSIYVIGTLLEESAVSTGGNRDIHTLNSEFRLTSLLIEEMVHAVRAGHLKHMPNGNNDSLWTPRLTLLSYIILYDPSHITPELGRNLWHFMIEHESLGPSERDRALLMLSGLITNLASRNVFIDQCISELLPALHPCLLTPAVMVMVEKAISYEHRMSSRPPICEHEIIEIAGTELLWRLILSAPPGTIEKRAIGELVKLYLDPVIIDQAPRSAIEATHLALLDRCVSQLTSAAAKIKGNIYGASSGNGEPMVLVANIDDQPKAEELSFSRSLFFLREVLRGMRYRFPRITPTTKIPNPPAATEPQNVDSHEGNAITIRYQLFDSNNNSEGTHTLEIGDLQTIGSLKQRLALATKHPHIRAFWSGSEVDLEQEAAQTLRQKGIGAQPTMMIQLVTPRGGKKEGPPSAGGLHSFEVELMKHFDELYDLLGLHERFAAEIWEFLAEFPPQERIRKAVSSIPLDGTAVFPAQQPFKTMYSASTMAACLEDDLLKGDADEDFISRCVRSLIDVLMNDGQLCNGTNVMLRIKVLNSLVECLYRFLKEPVSVETSSRYFVDAESLVNRFAALLESPHSTQTWTTAEWSFLSCRSFSCILECSIHDARVWRAFTARKDMTALIQRLILDDYRAQSRKNIGDTISSFCKFIPDRAKVSAQEFASYFWQVLVSILPEAAIKQKQPQSSEYFDASLVVFHAVRNGRRADLDTNKLICDWGELLLGHTHKEMVGRDTIDDFVHGMTRLLHCCLKMASASAEDVDTCNLGERVFEAFLFPELSTAIDAQRLEERCPVLHSQTRRELYQLVLLLSQEPKTFEKVIGLVSDLFPERYLYHNGWGIQRTEWLRSPTGYVGLWNLSNTCYLNSLVTQLFMNVGFRKFMIEAKVADADGSQRLLSETQKLFAFMQNSWREAVEPRGLAGSVRTWENKLIDVSVQMDVDEFYNLLFDRWEAQILSDRDKKAFRSFYGGQLVQQVKPKECQHVSEREEPFSAIQCDIKGKHSLEDSLRAYVEGEFMEGDNKYSCTICKRHVDAVKRTCLKEIPDNLIFHLKRFDFDLRTMQRHKINDHFQFPTAINMRPYQIEQLSDPHTTMTEDMFELVGVLVHSGTAESGHYYSFIRERPITSMTQPGWVQFNDADVHTFDPENLASQCFGGIEGWSQGGPPSQMSIPKPYSAYMLFYQRSNSLKAAQQEQVQIITEGPKSLPLPVDLGNHIALDNECLTRKYCLFDPFQAPFVRSLLETMGQVHGGKCSEDHVVERRTIYSALNQVDQTVSRTKDLPELDNMMQSLLKVTAACEGCCQIALDWMVTNIDGSRNLLLRNPNGKIRREYVVLIMHVLQTMRARRHDLYVAENQISRSTGTVDGEGPVNELMRMISALWDDVVGTTHKGWDDYFGLLVGIASMGDDEASIVIKFGFIHKCLIILLLETLQQLQIDHERLWRRVQRGAKISYFKLIELLRILLARFDLQGTPGTSSEGKMEHLTDSEDYLFKFPGNRKTVAFINKILDTNHNPGAAKAIIAQMVAAEPELGMLPALLVTIKTGIAADPASFAAPYLHAAIAYCENAPRPEEAKLLIADTARDIETIGNSGGREHLSFFEYLMNVQNPRWPRVPDFYLLQVLDTCPMWAPPLLLYWEPMVREGTEALIQHMIFRHGNPARCANAQLEKPLEHAARVLGEACLEKINDRFTSQRIQVDSKIIEPICNVIEVCQGYFDSDDGDFSLKRDNIMSQLRDLTTEEVEDAGSGGVREGDPLALCSPEADEWDNESTMASESDVDAAVQLDMTNP